MTINTGLVSVFRIICLVYLCMAMGVGGCKRTPPNEGQTPKIGVTFRVTNTGSVLIDTFTVHYGEQVAHLRSLEPDVRTLLQI